MSSVLACVMFSLLALVTIKSPLGDLDGRRDWREQVAWMMLIMVMMFGVLVLAKGWPVMVGQ
jgi:hypothetical protein